MRLALGRRSIASSNDAIAVFLGLRSGAARRVQVCLSCRHLSSAANPSVHDARPAETATVGGERYPKDSWTNIPDSIFRAVGKQLHLQRDHPISITRQIIESKFPSPTYKYHNEYSPVVTTYQNFDSLGFPEDHPGRSKTDTYYLNKDTVLRTHTSAHEADIFRANETDGYLISADVYRRDAIDRSHYPVFHQMEGARMWDRSKVPNGDIVKAIYEDLARLPTHDMKVMDPNPTFHQKRNPLQVGHHTAEEAEAIAAHLKRSLELVVVEIFSRARAAAASAKIETSTEPLQVRWIEASFPWTSPSWELEILWRGGWLEVLGCGVVKQTLLNDSGVSEQSGWAFGVGLERIAMLLFEIPDIRLFWSTDARFLEQFKGVSADLTKMKRFVPFSKFPACCMDVAFWLPSTSSAAGGGTRANSQDFHENDFMEIVRDIGGDKVEDVKVLDEFKHPETGRMSRCYRILYRSLERTLTNSEVVIYHNKLREALVQKLGLELR